MESSQTVALGKHSCNKEMKHTFILTLHWCRHCIQKQSSDNTNIKQTLREKWHWLLFDCYWLLFGDPKMSKSCKTFTDWALKFLLTTNWIASGKDSNLCRTPPPSPNLTIDYLHIAGKKFDWTITTLLRQIPHNYIYLSNAGSWDIIGRRTIAANIWKAEVHWLIFHNLSPA